MVMNKVRVAIYDSDMEFARRLTNYLNGRYGEKIDAEVFTKKEHLIRGLSETSYDCVVSDDLDGVGIVYGIQICDTESEEGYYRYGSAKALAMKLLEKANPSTQISKEQKRIAIYDPAGTGDATKYALNQARSLDGIYIGMEEFCSLDTNEFWMEELLFLIKQREEEVVSKMQEHLQWIEGTRGLPSARCYLDYRYLEFEDYEWFFEQLSKHQAGQIVFDIGSGSLMDFQIFQLFDSIHIFTSAKIEKKRQIEMFMQLLCQQIPGIRERILLIPEEDGERERERSNYSKDYGADGFK